ncbi:BZ3500_MvSof-1268-A1-R1_Chr6-3g08948 [Microbotryum saponariae]|uniref:BZ3500_MvSof-1268-A1-R1_Chr6-3g08948 protein n=1 Tax=Microbotryum saponariae TaxID=289078 RepID=A0A2X0L562_9BASI|nr:BZ3500_MvSof-1268-A1-R1_Chr6-3g08948 [Microbotryum saponariae]SDA07550.1 BZ3501_MvSof-1269-A2-R1_Chr6-2g08652 [Microbotryum saponariae]
MRMKMTRRTKRVVMVKVKEKRSRWIDPSRSQLFAYYSHDRDNYFSIPHCTQRLSSKNLRLTTTQSITDSVANGLTPDQIGRSVISGLTFKNRRRGIKQCYQDAMACDPEWPETKAALWPDDKACNHPELILRVFEAKLNRLCGDLSGTKQRAGYFGDEWRTVSLLYFVLCFSASAEMLKSRILFDSSAI